jgi:prophage regulatory protein
MKILTYTDLKPLKGIPYSKVQLWRLERADKFPKRISIGPNRHGWAEHEIDAHISACITARDNGASIKAPRRRKRLGIEA